jgi:hypothetical protein
VCAQTPAEQQSTVQVSLSLQFGTTVFELAVPESQVCGQFEQQLVQRSVPTNVN